MHRDGRTIVPRAPVEDISSIVNLVNALEQRKIEFSVPFSA
jgi:hypothetical protein